MKPLEQLVRPNIWSLAPYSSARDEYSGKEAHVFLDANENPYNAPYNRYPDPLQREVKQLLERVKGVPAENIFLGNGSDEAIDLPYRIFCEPGRDNVVSIAPTYGMYQVCADINNVECRQVLLDDGFTLNADKLLNACDANTKIIWLCSPNNPTGNSLDRDEMMNTSTLHIRCPYVRSCLRIPTSSFCKPCRRHGVQQLSAWVWPLLPRRLSPYIIR